jgi:peptidyl-prolyl cis-trans isomerase B (cyclophilin B)
MADRASLRRAVGVGVVFTALVFTGFSAGCNRGAAKSTGKKLDVVRIIPSTNISTESEPANPLKLPGDPRLNQAFADATRAEAPADWEPRDVTATGKSLAKIYTDVVRLWREIPFATAEGKRIEYTAVVETDLGEIEMALLPDVAPNHVRNFVALARSGYYDGLTFERILNQEVEDKSAHLDLIEGGGPAGLADPEYDSLGYWLKPETDAKVVHEEGSVGAPHGNEPDTAACKFYITLGKPPTQLNGLYTIFGKVTRGLDVARKIHQQPVIDDEDDRGYFRPAKAVLIHKVSIQTKEVDNLPSTPENNGK